MNAGLYKIEDIYIAYCYAYEEIFFENKIQKIMRREKIIIAEKIKNRLYDVFTGEELEKEYQFYDDQSDPVLPWLYKNYLLKSVPLTQIIKCPSTNKVIPFDILQKQYSNLQNAN